MKIKKYLISTIMLIIGGLITYIFTDIRSRNDNKKRFVEYRLDETQNVFVKPNLANKKISILIDDRPIEQLSQLRITLYNFSDRDFHDLNVYFELYYPNGDTIKLVNTNSFRDENITDGIKPIESLNPSILKGAIKKGLSLTTLCRKEGYYASLTSDFYFEGNIVPKCNVFIDQNNSKEQYGVEARLYDYNNINTTPWYNDDDLWFFTILFLIIFILVKLLNYGNEKQRIKKVNYILDKLKAQPDTLQHGDEYLANEFIYLYDLFLWEDAPKFIRWLFRMKRPERKHQMLSPD